MSDAEVSQIRPIDAEGYAGALGVTIWGTAARHDVPRHALYSAISVTAWLLDLIRFEMHLRGFHKLLFIRGEPKGAAELRRLILPAMWVVEPFWPVQLVVFQLDVIPQLGFVIVLPQLELDGWRH